jgi:hypothetical protein
MSPAREKNTSVKLPEEVTKPYSPRFIGDPDEFKPRRKVFRYVIASLLSDGEIIVKSNFDMCPKKK